MKRKKAVKTLFAAAVLLTTTGIGWNAGSSETLFGGVAAASFAQVNTVPYHPLNPLTADELNSAAWIVKGSGKLKADMRFTEIKVKEPEKSKVWAWNDLSAEQKKNKKNRLSRQAEFVVVQGRQVFEGSVDLNSKKLLAWKEVKQGQPMYTDEEYELAEKLTMESKEFRAALIKRGITDLSKVKVDQLEAGYYGDEDTHPSKRLMKLSFYLMTKDNNHYAHPIEGLIVTVDLGAKKVDKVDESGVIPVPMEDHGYVKGDPGNMRQPAKPIYISQPKGVNYSINGNEISWQNFKFHLRFDPRVGPIISTLTYNDHGKVRKIMYSGSFGGMTVPYGDPSDSWYFRAYMDSGSYGMGKLGRPLVKGADTPDNVTFIDAILNDDLGKPYTSPKVMGMFERYADMDWTHASGDKVESRARMELVLRYISTIGNYDYIIDWVFQQNGNIKINAGAAGLEAVKATKRTNIHDTGKDHYHDSKSVDTRNGTLLDEHIIGTYHQHIYNFRLDMDIDGIKNSVLELQPKTVPVENKRRTSEIVLDEKVYKTEQDAKQKFKADKIVLITNQTKENSQGYWTGYQIIANAGGTHPFAEDLLAADDDYISKRVGFAKNHLWVTPFSQQEIYPEGKYVNQNPVDTGLGAWTEQNRSIYQADDVVWVTTGTTHIPRAEEWPMMSTEWVSTMLKPFNFFNETPTLDLPKSPYDKNDK
ncbi:hypothetical protein [Paenibacillus beijingensis]|uniref:copper amine oxidase n=1 Tax=Paenibacillus beijingensis TaxID=1126833 RepID=UPI000698EE7B|nr:hypothetical protein [Paenibacillus beijingensis]